MGLIFIGFAWQVYSFKVAGGENEPQLICLPGMRAIIKLASVKLMERKKLSIEQNKSIPKYTSARVTPLVIIQSSSSQLFSCTIFYIAGQGSV